MKNDYLDSRHSRAGALLSGIIITHSRAPRGNAAPARCAKLLNRRSAPKPCYHAARGNKKLPLPRAKLNPIHCFCHHYRHPAHCQFFYSFPRAAWECSSGALRQVAESAQRA